jgi:hypothetical protein
VEFLIKEVVDALFLELLRSWAIIGEDALEKNPEHPVLRERAVSDDQICISVWIVLLLQSWEFSVNLKKEELLEDEIYYSNKIFVHYGNLIEKSSLQDFKQKHTLF